jgi:hypothetical protein
MNRKEFLKTVWMKGVKPLVKLLLALYCLNFFYKVITEAGGERTVVILLLSISSFIILVHILDLIFKSLKAKLVSSIPQKYLYPIHNISQLLEYFVILAYGAFLYYHWTLYGWDTLYLVILIAWTKLDQLRNKEQDSNLSNA